LYIWYHHLFMKHFNLGALWTFHNSIYKIFLEAQKKYLVQFLGASPHYSFFSLFSRSWLMHKHKQPKTSTNQTLQLKPYKKQLLRSYSFLICWAFMDFPLNEPNDEEKKTNKNNECCELCSIRGCLFGLILAFHWNKLEDPNKRCGFVLSFLKAKAGNTQRGRSTPGRASRSFAF
jgi:hypothetical protein